MVSQRTAISQTIGLTDIAIVYHSPGVKGRTIWGGLVPYNEVWRAGANENTTIACTDPVKVDGHDLAAGTYGFHAIPGEREWTLIFSKNFTSWGSFFYDKSEDALRIKVKPIEGSFTEWLTYDFTNREETSVVIELKWEKIVVPFRIDVDVHSVVLRNFRLDLRGINGFSWQAFNQAAAYCLVNKINTEEALQWIDRAIRFNPNFSNIIVKEGLLRQVGRNGEADEIRKNAMKIATEAEMNAHGYQLLASGKTKEAIDIFLQNVEKYPDSWNAYDSLGEGYEKNGNLRLALEYYTKAFERVSDETQKNRLKNTIANLKSQVRLPK